MLDILEIKATIDDEWDCIVQKGESLFIRDNQETVYTVLKIGDKFIVTNCKKCMMWIVMSTDAVIGIIK